MIWLTSDQHFNNENIIKYESVSRPFSSVEEMNETLIKNWNSKIKPGDEVYVLGDFIMGQGVESIPKILNRLNGKITLVRGNHDSPAKIKKYKECGIEVKDIDYITYKGITFILCHYPIVNEEFAILMTKSNPLNVFCLYGHLHSHAPLGIKNNSYHIGVDTNNLYPVSIEEIHKLINENPI